MSDPDGILSMPGHLIRRLHQISVAIFSERMAEAGQDLTPVQFAALSWVAAVPGLDQATLSGAIAYDRATIGGVLDRLQSKGLVRRDVSVRDRRARTLAITEAGRKVLEITTPIVRELQNDILAGLDPDERKTLLDLLAKAAEAGKGQSRVPSRPTGQG